MTALQSIIKEAKAIRKKSPKMEWKKAVAQASAIYASKHKGKSPVGKKHAVKKKAVKKVAKKKAVGVIKKKAIKKIAKKVIRKKPSVSKHIDTKSHNVNIKVMSGISSAALGNVSYIIDKIKSSEHQFQILKNRKKNDKKLVGFDLVLYKRYPGYIKSLKKQLSEAKKHIK